MNHSYIVIPATALSMFTASVTMGQTSSLYLPASAAPGPAAPPAAAPTTGVSEKPAQLTGDASAATAATANGGSPALTATGEPSRLSPSIARVSYVAVAIPDPKKFAVHDLVTIVVRESTQNDASSNLKTTKENKYTMSVPTFPQIELLNFISGALGVQKFTDQPNLNLDYKNDFKGNGDYSRKDTITSRITAEIIDVKPNGTLVLEARKFIKSDKESLNMVLTGTCRKQDVATDNTVQSTQLSDLHLVKDSTGELKDASKKGMVSKVLDFIFNF